MSNRLDLGYRRIRMAHHASHDASGFGFVLAILLVGSSSFAQSDSVRAHDNVESRLDHYLHFAHPIGSARMEFPGPNGGYTFIHLPTKEVMEWGDTVIKDHTYLLDLNITHEGLYLAPDTMVSISDYTPFEFVFPNNRIIHAKLALSHTREHLRDLDSSFNGVLGYGLIRQFITVFDFKRNQLTFYPLYASISIADDDSNAIQLPIVDDAKITYCHCPVSTIWLDVQAPPLLPGHVHLSFEEPQSQVFQTALDSATRRIVTRQALKDSLAGNKRPLGLNLAQFIIGAEDGHPINFAGRGRHRMIDPLPAIYKDLTVSVLGTLGTDVLRTFSAIIIDPSRNKLIFVK